jgi:hypothetical protein
MKNSLLTGPIHYDTTTDFNFHASDSHYTSDFNVSNRQLNFFFECNISEQLFNFLCDYSIVAKISQTMQHLLQQLGTAVKLVLFLF